MRLSLAVVIFALSISHTAAQSLADRAADMLRFYSDQAPLPNEQPNFALNISYPTNAPPPVVLPWQEIDFVAEPEAYADSILRYILDDTDLLAADFNVEASQRWFHAPWLARENLRGMTAERRSDTGELALGSPDGIQNWAVAVYNDIGGYTLGQVWKDPLNPNGAAARFGIGTMTFKLLFTEATPAQVPYLQGSKVWNANIRPDTKRAVEMRLLQLDFGVRDARADQWTGWVFGTFMYVAPAGADETTQFDWANMVPVGVTWGADPTLLGYNYNVLNKRPTEGWMNPVVVSMMEAIRTPQAGFASPHLGLFGRVNGPVDNPKSSCLACHGRAIDFGKAVTSGYRNAVLPFDAGDSADDFKLQWFFRNLKPDEPFLHNTASLDYSLQLQVGIGRFRSWLANQVEHVPLSAPIPNQLTSIVPQGLELELPAMEFERGR